MYWLHCQVIINCTDIVDFMKGKKKKKLCCMQDWSWSQQGFSWQVLVHFYFQMATHFVTWIEFNQALYNLRNVLFMLCVGCLISSFV